MSDTPRTDAETGDGQGKAGRTYVTADFARFLERELAGAIALIPPPTEPPGTLGQKERRARMILNFMSMFPCWNECFGGDTPNPAMPQMEKQIAVARANGWSDLSIECREDDSLFIYGKPPNDETYREFDIEQASRFFNFQDTRPHPELAILDVINALRAVIVRLTQMTANHRAMTENVLLDKDAETLLNLLADAEAKLQLP